jgi:hypothetical protein
MRNECDTKGSVGVLPKKEKGRKAFLHIIKVPFLTARIIRSGLVKFPFLSRRTMGGIAIFNMAVYQVDLQTASLGARAITQVAKAA